MQVRSDTDRCCDEDEVFDDVLTDESRDKRCLPALSREKYEREKCHDHVDKEEWDHDADCTFDEKEDTDETFKQCKCDIKRTKRHRPTKCTIKESMHETARG